MREVKSRQNRRKSGPLAYINVHSKNRRKDAIPYIVSFPFYQVIYEKGDYF